MFKKYFLASVLVSSLMLPAVFAATDSSAINVVSNNESVSSSNLGVENTGILPTNPFYFIKEWSRNIQRIFTFNPVAKARLELNIANEKAAETKKIEEVSPNNVEAINKALGNYQNSQERLKTKLEALKENSQNPEIDKLLNQAVVQAAKHEAVFNEIAKKFEDQSTVKNSVEDTNNKIEETTAAISNVEKTPEELKKPLEEIEQPPTAKEAVKTTIGIICSKEYNPVCGKDGNTYGNACEANAAGIPVNYEGKCEKSSVKPDLNSKLCSVSEKNSSADGQCESSGSENKPTEIKSTLKPIEAPEAINSNNVNSIVATSTTIVAPKVISSGTVESDLINVFVTIDETGKFIPQQSKVKKGGKITWVNKGKFFVWPFSEDYPNLDSLRGISSGETYSVIFEKTGTWKYSDYLNSLNFGTIEVID